MNSQSYFRRTSEVSGDMVEVIFYDKQNLYTVNIYHEYGGNTNLCKMQSFPIALFILNERKIDEDERAYLLFADLAPDNFKQAVFN